MPLSEQSQDPNTPAVQGIADTTNQVTAGVGVFGCVGLPDKGLPGAPPLSFVGVYGSTVSIAVAAGTAPNPPAMIGVYGASSTGTGVYGRSTNVGVKGESEQGDAIVGLSHSSQHAGISGQNDAGGFGVWADSENGTGIYGHSTANIAIQGESQNADAVNGLSHSNQHAGVAAHNVNGGPGLWAAGNPAGYFAGDIVATGQITSGSDLKVPGTITVGHDVIFASGAGDFAEDFDLTHMSTAEPGTVMVLGERGSIEPSQRAYDRKVAGVISGAGHYRPGLVLDRRPQGDRSPKDERGTLALVGKVFCKVDADYGGIHPGDMLTTSPTPGYAMRADDPARAFGSVIGKALGTCESGRALVPILVALQ